ncbi:MAG: DUF4292 domain-containing protein [Muribaculaceae bacterium]|nr:DUF4292 domain-containing protein [Muribaculaceae bacterium]
MMKQRNKWIWALPALLLALTVSCHTGKKVVDSNVAPNSVTEGVTVPAPAQSQAEASRLAQIVAKQGGWTTMQSGGSVSISGAKSFSSSMQIKMVRDRAILISLRPLLGIEVGKLIITGDSVIVIDKVHKQYIAENVSLITNGIPATVSTVQDLFLGRAFLLGGGDLRQNMDKLKFTENGSVAVIEPKEQPKEFSYSFTYGSNDKILSVNVAPNGAGAGSLYKAEYSNVQLTLAGNVAGAVSVSTELNGTRFNLDLEYNSIRWNEPLDIDANIPGGYKKISGRNLLNILG